MSTTIINGTIQIISGSSFSGLTPASFFSSYQLSHQLHQIFISPFVLPQPLKQDLSLREEEKPRKDIRERSHLPELSCVHYIISARFKYPLSHGRRFLCIVQLHHPDVLPQSLFQRNSYFYIYYANHFSFLTLRRHSQHSSVGSRASHQRTGYFSVFSPREEMAQMRFNSWRTSGFIQQKTWAISFTQSKYDL